MSGTAHSYAEGAVEQLVNLRFQKISGVKGAVKLGNQIAASFSAWTLLREDAPHTWAFSAQCETVNTFLATKGPDVLVLDAGKLGMLRWRGVTLEIGGDRVTATLVGSPEVR